MGNESCLSSKLSSFAKLDSMLTERCLTSTFVGAKQRRLNLLHVSRSNEKFGGNDRSLNRLASLCMKNRIFILILFLRIISRSLRVSLCTRTLDPLSPAAKPSRDRFEGIFSHRKPEVCEEIFVSSFLPAKLQLSNAFTLSTINMYVVGCRAQRITSNAIDVSIHSRDFARNFAGSALVNEDPSLRVITRRYLLEPA